MSLMADVAVGRDGPDARAAASFPALHKGKAPDAEERFAKEAHRLYGVLGSRLTDREFVANDYSIADIAIWPPGVGLRVADCRSQKIP